MIKAYIPQAKTKQGKSSIRGLWHSDKQGVCYDYLKRVNIEPHTLIYVKRHYRQEALFYREGQKAYIWYNKNKVEELRRYSYFSYNRYTRGLKAFLKDILTTYGGFTVYIREQNYLIEVWL